MPNRVLIVESGVKAAQTLARYFEEREDEVWHAWKLDEAVSLLDLVQPDWMLLDIHIPGDSWLDFLSQTRDKFPNLQIIMTTKQIDLQREVLARQRGVDVFVRQPFTHRWLDQAIKQLQQRHGSENQRIARAIVLPPVRLPIYVKVIAPFLILAIIFSLLAFFINLQASYDLHQSYQNDHLSMTAVQGNNWLAKNEARMLISLREMTSTQGLAAAIMRRDSKMMAAILEPLAANNQQDAVEVLDLMGNDIFSVQRSGQTYHSESVQKTIFAQEHAVEMALRGISDHVGDKYVFLADVPAGHMIYLGGPVYEENGQPMGVILVGRSLPSLVMDMQHDLSVNVTLYDMNGHVLSTTLPLGTAQELQKEKAQQILQNQNPSAAYTRKITLEQTSGDEIFFPWQVRDGSQIGMVGLTLNVPPIYAISPWLQVEAGILIVLVLGTVCLVGYQVASLFRKTIQRLLNATAEVNRGNLVTKVDVSGNDELSVLTHAFNSMLFGFQQNMLYRDLMGYAPPDITREKMRQTFETEGFNLRGQQANVTILISDVHDFTSLANNMDPEKAVEILNDYFEHLAAIVVTHNGVINKLEGDAMIVVFGALPDHLTPEESAEEACQAAAAMLLAIRSFNEKNVKKGLPALVTGISIHTGPVILGGLTIRDQLHYTPIGETVRTAHHLEALTNQISSDKSDIFISQDTYELLEISQNEYLIHNIGQYVVKEDGSLTTVYRLVPAHWEAGEEISDG
jgi:class 3 adenylate cyclase/CheY-like chemotaxis protein